MTPFGDLDTRPPRRPVSPFVVLLLGGAATALSSEWLRFQGVPAVAIVAAVLGSVVTIASVGRAYRARRRWRRDAARRSAGLLTIREEDGRLAIVHAVARDASPSPLLARPAGEGTTQPPRSALGTDRDHETSRDDAAADASEATRRQPSHADG